MKSQKKPFTVEIRKRRGGNAKDGGKRAIAKLLEKLHSGTEVPAARS
ncbi:hypothetical protein [Rhizobium leguminosarum]|nr:hypothetical protein [Rhizobium leguminosarum]